jgi:hypothetical protein
MGFWRAAAKDDPTETYDYRSGAVGADSNAEPPASHPATHTTRGSSVTSLFRIDIQLVVAISSALWEVDS